MLGTQSQLGFGGMRSTISIVNAHSSGGTQVGGLSGNSMPGARYVLSGALTAGALATMLDIPVGIGEVPLLALASLDGTTRTVRLRVTVDGVVVFDATSSAITGGGQGIHAAGALTSTGFFVPSLPIVFVRSFKVEIASSLSETDKLGLGYILHRSA
jgi:hypothetical protein